MPRLSDIDLLVLDFDGVLTDNRVFVFEDGREGVVCNRADGLGCDMLRAAGLPIVILSTETNPVVRARAEKLKVEVVQGSTDKSESLKSILAEQGIDPARCAYVGNDVNDLDAMRSVKWPIAPADAHPQILAIAALVLSSRGGEGVVRELADILIEAQGS